MRTARPHVLRHTVPEYVETTFTCLSCDEDMEYQEGLSCTNCGLEWAHPTDYPVLADMWIEFAEAVKPDATPEAPVHLMIYRERDYQRAHAWFIHLGCVEDSYDHTGKCALTDAIGTNDYGRAPALAGIDDNVPWAWGRAGLPTLPTGAYLIEPASEDGVRVRAVLAYAGGEDAQNLGVLIDPRETTPRLLRLLQRDARFESAPFDTEAWERARSPEFLAYWAREAEYRRRLAAPKAQYPPAEVIVELPPGD